MVNVTPAGDSCTKVFAGLLANSIENSRSASRAIDNTDFAGIFHDLQCVGIEDVGFGGADGDIADAIAVEVAGDSKCITKSIADRGAITQGYAGVYSSFLLHAQRAAERYGVPAHEILQRVGEAGYVGGQEDMIIDVALQLTAERDQAAR